MAQSLWFVAPRVAELREDEVPPPATGQVLVEAECGLVSAGSEGNLYRGEGNLPNLRLPTGRGQIPFPVNFGYQEIGRVAEASPGASLKVGDRVLCSHPHQDRFVINEDSAWVIPENLSSERAALASLFNIGLNACISTPPLVGDCVAVSGLGVVGSFTARLARRHASRLILIDPSESRRQLADWIGADAVVSPEDAGSVIDEMSSGRGADLFFEASGAPAALQCAIDNTGMEGTITVISWYGTRTATLRLSPEFHLKRHKVISTGPSLPPSLAPRWDRTRLRQIAWEYLAADPAAEGMITHRVDFSEAPLAYQLLDDPSSGALGVLLVHSTAAK